MCHCLILALSHCLIEPNLACNSWCWARAMRLSHCALSSADITSNIGAISSNIGAISITIRGHQLMAPMAMAPSEGIQMCGHIPSTPESEKAQHSPCACASRIVFWRFQKCRAQIKLEVSNTKHRRLHCSNVSLSHCLIVSLWHYRIVSLSHCLLVT